MGNRALRKLVAKAIKEYGLSTKLYRKKHNRKALTAKCLHTLLDQLKYKPGMVFNDCNGFNKRVIAPVGSYQNPNCQSNRFVLPKQKMFRTKDTRQLSGYFFRINHFLTDLGSSCSCGGEIFPALSQQEIEEHISEILELRVKHHSSPQKQEIFRIFLDVQRAGHHLTDEDGCLLSEIKEIL